MTMHKQWEEVLITLKELHNQYVRLDRDMPEQPPTDLNTVNYVRDLADDLTEKALHLSRKLSHYRGYISGQEEQRPEPREAPDVFGNVVITITPGTAPCSEIGAALSCSKRPGGLTATQVSAIAKRLGLDSAGRVEWEMADGSVRTAKTYDLDQFQKILMASISWGYVDNMKYEPPYRLRGGR